MLAIERRRRWGFLTGCAMPLLVVVAGAVASVDSGAHVGGGPAWATVNQSSAGEARVVPATTVLEGPQGLGSVAMASDGTLAAGPVGRAYRGEVQVREPGGRWMSVAMGAVVDPPVVASDRGGRVLAVAWRGRGSRRALIRRERDARGRWSAVSVITRGDFVDAVPGDPAVVLDGAGRAIVTWRNGGRQYAAVRRGLGRWGAPVGLGEAVLSPAYRENLGYAAVAALAGDGTGWVAWEGDGRISVARIAPGADGFGRVRRVGMRGSHRPVLAARADGAAVLAWVGPATVDDVFDSGRPTEEAPVFAAVLSRSGWVGRPARLSNRRTGASEPYVVSSASGETTVVWQPDDGNNARYATAARDGRFSRARMLAGVRVGFGIAGCVPLAMRADGTALLLAEGPRGATVLARRPGGAFRTLPLPPGTDEATGAEGAGMAVSGLRMLAVWQRPSDPDSIDPSGEAVLAVTPGIA